MNEGVFPSRKVRTIEGMEEERRLAFVAMTRAEKRLFLSEAEGRNLDGSPKYPSRFLLDIRQDLLEYTQIPREGLIRDAWSYIRNSENQMQSDAGKADLMPVGTRVRHTILGNGTIVGVDPDRNAYTVAFDSLATPRTIAFRVPLTKI